MPAGVTSYQALLVYEGAARELVLGLKYRNQRLVLGRLGHALACLLDGDQLARIEVVTWAPTSPTRRRQRGFDQAELLARATARQLQRPAVALLRREAGVAQTGQRRAARLAGPTFLPRAAAPAGCLVIDDVLTTGATVSAAAAALRAAGAITVDVLTAACTPSGTVRAATTERDKEHGPDGSDASS